MKTYKHEQSLFFLADTIYFPKYLEIDIPNLVFGTFEKLLRTSVQTSINGFKSQVAGCWNCEICSFVLPSHPQDVQSCGML